MRLRQEQRTLSILIGLGVLLGAGLALAAPFEERGSRRPADTRSSASPVLTRTSFPSATPGVGDPTPGPPPTPTASRAGAGSRGGNADDCAPAEPVPDRSPRPATILRAIHVLAVNCGRGDGRKPRSRTPSASPRQNTSVRRRRRPARGVREGRADRTGGASRAAPPPIGSGGSRDGGGTSQSVGPERAETDALGGDVAHATVDGSVDPPVLVGSGPVGRRAGR
jgi:hypothetical protein